MVCHGSRGGLGGKVRDARTALLDDHGAALCELLPAQAVQRAVEAEGVGFRDCLFTPLVTLWAFLGQVLAADGSCRAAVARLIALLAARGRAASGQDEQQASPATDPYCKARQRLPESLVARLARDAGGRLHDRYPAGRLLGGRPVKVVDGTTVSMPDTADNQKLWPQPPTQKPGLGFPLARLVAVMSLNCAAVLSLAIGPYAGKQSGETALFRTLALAGEGLARGDVLLADRYYASFWAIAMLLDAQAYGKDEIARAFACRWHAELDLRAIKQVMGMSVLRCKTAAMVRKEIWVHLLAYNLVRGLMARAAEQAGIEPRQVSFAGAVQTVNAFAAVLELADERDRPRLLEILLRAIARHRVGDRPNRYEPRAVKRRAKPIAWLTVPREQARKRLARSGEAKC